MVHFQVYIGRKWDSDEAPVGNKPTAVGSWGQREKNAWGAIMECMSGAALNTMQWVVVYMEVVAAVEAQRAKAPMYSVGIHAK